MISMGHVVLTLDEYSEILEQGKILEEVSDSMLQVDAENMRLRERLDDVLNGVSIVWCKEDKMEMWTELRILCVDNGYCINCACFNCEC